MILGVLLDSNRSNSSGRNRASLRARCLSNLNFIKLVVGIAESQAMIIYCSLQMQHLLIGKFEFKLEHQTSKLSGGQFVLQANNIE